MTKTNLAALFAACAALAACGGGGGNAPPPPPPPPPAPTTFTFSAPALGDTQVWNRTLTDSAGTQVPMQIRQTVTAVNADGSMVWTFDDPTGTSVDADGLTFRTTPETADISADGSEIDYTVPSSTGAPVKCTYTYPGSGSTTISAEADRARALGLAHAASLQVGDSWQTSYSIACDNGASASYSVMAAVYAVETITVPAGTFQAFRETVSTTWTSGGFTNGSGTTLYRDTGGALFPIQLDETIVHGDTSTPYFTHDHRELLRRD